MSEVRPVRVVSGGSVAVGQVVGVLDQLARDVQVPVGVEDGDDLLLRRRGRSAATVSVMSMQEVGEPHSTSSTWCAHRASTRQERILGHGARMLPRLFRPQCLRASAHSAPRPGKKGEFDFSSVRRPVRSASSVVPDTSRAPKSSVTGAVATSWSDESRVCGISRRPRRSGPEHRIFFSAADNGRTFLLPGSSPARPLGLLTSNGSDFNSRSTQCLPPSLQIFFAHQLGLPAGAEGRSGQAAATTGRPGRTMAVRAGRSEQTRASTGAATPRVRKICSGCCRHPLSSVVPSPASPSKKVQRPGRERTSRSRASSTEHSLPAAGSIAGEVQEVGSGARHLSWFRAGAPHRSERIHRR